MSNSDNPRNGAIFQQQVKNWFQNHFETSFELEKKNGLSLKEIASSLNGYGITADRKTLYSDFEQLRRFGVDIISQQKGRDLLYCVCSRQFLGWIVAIGDGLRITGPSTVVSMMRKEAGRLKEIYS